MLHSKVETEFRRIEDLFVCSDQGRKLQIVAEMLIVLCWTSFCRTLRGDEIMLPFFFTVLKLYCTSSHLLSLLWWSHISSHMFAPVHQNIVLSSSLLKCLSFSLLFLDVTIDLWFNHQKLARPAHTLLISPLDPRTPSYGTRHSIQELMVHQTSCLLLPFQSPTTGLLSYAESKNWSYLPFLLAFLVLPLLELWYRPPRLFPNLTRYR